MNVSPGSASSSSEYSVSKMRIVHTESSLGWGGQELRVLTEARGMIDRGHQVEVWAPAESNIFVEAQRHGIPCRAVPIARRKLRGLWATRRMLSLARVDVINTHSSTDSWLVALARLTLRDAPPMVRTRHIAATVPNDFATRWLYNHASRHVVTTGERMRQTLISRNRLRESRVTSIPTGVDIERFRPGDRDQMRRVLGLELAHRYIGIVATLRSWKGHLYLIDAFAQLANDDEALRLVIVGDGPMQARLEERIRALGLESKVILTGRRENVEQWMAAFDVFCLPSYANEGVPQAIVQAMLTALPIVTTAAGSITEAVADDVSGVVVPVKDSNALAVALKRVLADKAYATRLGAAARTEALSRFSLPVMIREMENVFRNVVEHHARRRRGLRAHWRRFGRSIDRRWREFRLPRGYERLGTKYGGWWIDESALGPSPLLIDCGLGSDISFSREFISRFSGRVIGVDPSPQSFAYTRDHCPIGMLVVNKAFWTKAGETLTFNMPRAQDELPAGADGISGSLLESHVYVGGGSRVEVKTTDFAELLEQAQRAECDVLKLDIEGAEYDVLGDLCASGGLAKAKQLLVEFHHGATHYTVDDTKKAVAMITEGGFRLMHVEGRNYIFRRGDFG